MTSQSASEESSDVIWIRIQTGLENVPDIWVRKITTPPPRVVDPVPHLPHLVPQAPEPPNGAEHLLHVMQRQEEEERREGTWEYPEGTQAEVLERAIACFRNKLSPRCVKYIHNPPQDWPVRLQERKQLFEDMARGVMRPVFAVKFGSDTELEQQREWLFRDAIYFMLYVDEVPHGAGKGQGCGTD